MNSEKLNQWVVDTFEKNGQIGNELDNVSSDDRESINFLLNYLVSAGFVKSEKIGTRINYVVQDLDKIKEFLGLNKKTEIISSLQDSTVINLPLSMHEKLISLKKNYSDLNIIELKDVFKKLLNSASDEVLIASPFIEIDGIAYILDELIDSASRGVSFKILTRDVLVKKSYNNTHTKKIKAVLKLYELFDQYQSNPNAFMEIRDFGEEVSDSHLNKLHYEGIHQKLMIVDKKYAYVGSGEIRSPSFLSNGESGYLTTGRQAEFWYDFFDIFWSNSKPVSKDFSFTL
ncbi:hypothetical protein BD31_I0834 [Candidatus Nitrosopumilus salaria BD31]|uniref:PLD phosphodiesterase domain-containing protein n=1 Tax=Candidatus Nitrosopumilus salarius BD31 TaxID=859350 RepID=I3D204_9ARCH|nr:phospholipase D family protein [Candidatus Nitrosopumilus salaria]EIJ65747.1 hypothetical protein BD31_I0834 [Candidatus Nitrosopumilus salaria BD31]